MDRWYRWWDRRVYYRCGFHHCSIDDPMRLRCSAMASLFVWKTHYPIHKTHRSVFPLCLCFSMCNQTHIGFDKLYYSMHVNVITNINWAKRGKKNVWHFGIAHFHVCMYTSRCRCVCVYEQNFPHFVPTHCSATVETPKPKMLANCYAYLQKFLWKCDEFWCNFFCGLFLYEFLCPKVALA